MQYVLNNSFNNNCMSKYLDMCMKPTDAQMVSAAVYSNLPLTTVTKIVPAFVLLVNDNYLRVINELNQKLYAGTVSLDAGITVPTLFNTLSCGDRDIRNKAIDYLVSKGICSLTASEVADAKKFVYSLIGFDYHNFNKLYDPIDNAYVFSYNTPVELSSKYLRVENTNNIPLYLAFFPMLPPGLTNIPTENGSTIFNCNKYYKPSNDTYVLQSTYIATKLSDINGDGDIRFDYLDVIEYLDDFRLRFRLPATFN